MEMRIYNVQMSENLDYITFVVAQPQWQIQMSSKGGAGDKSEDGLVLLIKVA